MIAEMVSKLLDAAEDKDQVFAAILLVGMVLLMLVVLGGLLLHVLGIECTPELKLVALTFLASYVAFAFGYMTRGCE